MKILMTSETYLPKMGGAEIHVFNLIKQLKLKSHKVNLFTNEPLKGKEDKSLIRLEWSKKNLIKIWRLLWRQSKGVNLIHCHYSYRLAAISGIIGRLRRIPVIVTLHGMGILDHPNTPFIYRIAHSVYRYLALVLSVHIISTSKDLAESAYKYVNSKKVTIIHNGFNENIFLKDHDISTEFLTKYKETKNILTVRRLVPKNGIQYVIEAMPYIVKKVPNVKYIIVGDGRMREYLEKMICDLSLKKYVEIIGELPNEEVPKYLKIADVVVFPSTAESSSIACAEAMAMGKYIIASRVGGLIELLGKKEERGRLIKLVDREESDYNAPMTIPTDRIISLADAIIKGLLGGNNNFKKNALNYAWENLSWDSVAKKTINIYESFIN